MDKLSGNKSRVWSNSGSSLNFKIQLEYSRSGYVLNYHAANFFCEIVYVYDMEAEKSSVEDIVHKLNDVIYI